ncbi:lactaldehyde reductase [soil metagenome]
MPSQISTYVWPGQTHFGFGASALLGPEAKTLGATHIFIIADPGVVAAGLLNQITPTLDADGFAYTVYTKVVPNPSVESVDAAAAAFRASGADLIVGIGGGSGMDTAKAVRELAGGPTGVSITEYSYLLQGDKVRSVPTRQQMPPMIAIPTTAGTGAEVTPWAVITDTTAHRKFGIGGPALLPDIALCDPALTLTLPPFLTAATGMDALTHLIEAYVSTNNHQPALDPLILYGIELIGRSLRIAVVQGSNAQARSDVMQGAMLGGIAISSNWLGACHALAHPLSSLANVPHGLANAIMLPHQMTYTLPGALERYAKIALSLDATSGAAGPTRQQAARAVEAVRELLVDVGLPTRLSEVGVQETQINPLAEQAILDLNHTTNPRSVTQAALEHLYRQAY